jgi:hypothetical protein
MESDFLFFLKCDLLFRHPCTQLLKDGMGDGCFSKESFLLFWVCNQNNNDDDNNNNHNHNKHKQQIRKTGFEVTNPGAKPEGPMEV